MKMFALFFWLSTVFAACGAEHVVLISIDGLRPDAIGAAKAVAMPELIRQGAYCDRAKTVRPSLTVPGHASMLTGLDVAHHGANWNEYQPGNIAVPTVFSMVKKAGKSTAAIVSKPKLYPLLAEETLDFRYVPPVPEHWDSVNPLLVKAGVRKADAGPPDTTASGIAKVFVREWPRRKPALTFVHFRETDMSGHRYGWMSDEYLDAVRICDRAVGSIWQAIQTSDLKSKTVVIVTSDHGGEGRFHLDDIPENMTIPWICMGPGVPKGLKIAREVSIKDNTPTVLGLLGVPVPKNLDGKQIGEVLGKSR